MYPAVLAVWSDQSLAPDLGLTSKTGQVLTVVKREKQEKHFKGKAIIFTVPSLILYQYRVDLLNFLNLKSSTSV